MILRMMYVIPMLLGRTYDVKKNSVGVDIYPREETANPRIIVETFYRSSFKTVESSSDVKDVLDISGDLSLNIKAGMFKVNGVGTYLKESLTTANSVDILTKVNFRTVSASLPHTAKLTPGWSSSHQLGTHVVQSILYGGDLIACVRFTAVKSEYLQDIRGVVKASLTTGNALDLVGEGKLEALDKALERKARMEINYFATVPLEGVPNNVTGLRDLVRNFESHVKKVNGGRGVPVEVELKELSALDHSFQFLKNIELETELEFFEEYFDDLLTTKSRFKSWVQGLPVTLTAEQEKSISEFRSRLQRALRAFFAVISTLDIEADPAQLDIAREAYKEGKGLGMAGKFRRELNKLVKKVVPAKEEPENRGTSTYTRYGASNCSSVQDTTTVYGGYLASAPKTGNATGGHNYLCFPRDPSREAAILDVHRTSGNGSGEIAGVKFGLLDVRPEELDATRAVLKGVVCAVCLVRQRPTLVTLAGATRCPEGGGWQLQYRGYLMATSDTTGSGTVCVDGALEHHTDSYMSASDQSLTVLRIAAGHSGGIPEDEEDKEAFRFVACVVCTK